MKKIIILNNFNLFDNRGAAINRIYEYARGLSNKDNNVHIVSLQHKEQTPYKLLYSDNAFIIGKKPEQKQNLNIKTRISIFLHLIRNSKKEEDVFFIYPSFTLFVEELLYLLILRFKGFKVFAERGERTIGIELNQPNEKNILKFIIRLMLIINAFFKDELCRIYNGNVVVSSNFEKWIFKRNKKLVRVPALLSTEYIKMAKNIFKKAVNNSVFNIGFTGSYLVRKEGHDILFKSVRILIDKYKVNVKITMYGHGKKNKMEELMNYINELDLSNYVEVNGFVSTDKVFNFLRSQDLLVLLRHSNIQTEYGFSTKLTEYLFSGVPVLASNVSDNAEYICDGNNGFIVNDLNPEIVAKKLYDIFAMDKIRLEEIGKNAKQTSLKYFCIDKYSDKILNLFSQ